MADERLLIELEALTDKFKAGLADAEKISEKAGTKIGDQLGSKASKSFMPSFLKIGAAIAGIGGTIAGALFSKASINAAIEQENAVNKLSASLRMIGSYSQETSQDLQNFAANIQKTTTVGDEAAMSLLSLSQSMGATAEQSKSITSAAIDISKAIGIDAESAVRGLSQTLGGQAGVLARYVPELRNFTKEQLKSGEAIDLLRSKFAGFAGTELNTFSGVLAQSKNAFGDMLEEIGNIVVKSPMMIMVIKKITEGIQFLTEKIKEFVGTNDFIKILLQGLASIGNVIINYVMPPFEMLFNMVNWGIKGVMSTIQAMIFGVSWAASQVMNVVSKFGIGKQLADDLATFTESSKEVLNEFHADFMQAGSAERIFDFSVTDAADNFNTKFTEFVESVKPTVATKGLELKQAMTGEANGAGSFFDQVADMVSSMSIGFDRSVTNMAETAKQMAQSIKQSFTNVISGSIQHVIKNIMAGEGAFANFAKFLLGTFGDMAIMLGNMFILKGLAIDATKSLVGGAAVAAGIALVALGSVMKAYSGGMGAGMAAGGAGGGIAGGLEATPETAIITEQTAGPKEPTTEISVNIMGDVLDSEESGMKIVDLINTAFDKQGVRIQRGVLA